MLSPSLEENLIRPPEVEITAEGVQGSASTTTTQPYYRTQRRLSDDGLGRSSMSSFAKWMYLLSSGLILLVVTPVLLYSLASNKAAGRQYLLPISIALVASAVPIAIYGIVAHVTNYWRPTLQKYVVRILWMVPVYSITSLCELCLWLRAEQGHSGMARWCVIPRAARDCYESYTVYNFFLFMLAFLEISSGMPADKLLRRTGASGQPLPETISSSSLPEISDNDILTQDDDLATVHHKCPPYTCMGDWRLDTGEFLQKTRYGVLLYTTLMPLCALALIIDAIFSDGSISDFDSQQNSQGAQAVVNQASTKNVSKLGKMLTTGNIAAFIQFMAANHAIYCLVLFYYVAHHLLQPCHPHLKFIAVKGLVFATFFQNIGIDMVFYAKPSLAQAFAGTTNTEAALGSVQSALMCIEMFIFALLHYFAFPVSQFPRVRRRDHPLFSQEDKYSVHDNCRDWLAAWGDFYASKKMETRRRREAGEFVVRRSDIAFTSHLLFDVSDIHADTSSTIQNLPADMATPILRTPSTAFLPRVMARWRHRPPRSVALARFVARTAGGNAPQLV